MNRRLCLFSAVMVAQSTQAAHVRQTDILGPAGSAAFGASVNVLSIGNIVVTEWVNGITGLSGTVSVTNSLVGSNNQDDVGSSVIALKNGNYVVLSPGWANGSASQARAIFHWGSACRSSFPDTSHH